jgi:formylglycine-generating enzyme required for sulfatase activity
VDDSFSSQDELGDLLRKLANLKSLRDDLGDEAFEKARAKLEARIRALVETGGGAYVEESVQVTGGDFVGRDKWQVVLGDQYVGLSPDQVPPEVLLQAYLRTLAAECRRLPLGVVDPRFLQAGSETPVPLPEVYVDLDVERPVQEEQETRERAFLGRLARGEGGERTPLLEAIAHPQVTRFVLLGDPGSGKTTFVNYLAYALAASVALAAPLQGMFPIRLVLREVAARCIPPEATKGEARMLWHALQADLAALLGEKAAEVLLPHLQHRLLKQGGMILLDGLDEVPEADRRRRCLLEAVADLSDVLPPDRSRVLVTARPYAYAAPEWRLHGFETLTLAPFNDEQVKRFVARWYQAVRPAMEWDEAIAQERGERLLEALAERPYLADLATRPLLLTLMATLHTSWGQLPQDRADLYEETTKLLLSRWQRAREVQGPDGRTVVEPGIARTLSVEESRVRTALHRLACQVHERQGQGTERELVPADIATGEVLAAFAPLLPENVDPRDVLKYLETRSGLLVGRAPGVYAFPHRSFQEYLTACHLADGPDFAAQLRARVWTDPAWWREVFLLGVGKAKQGGLDHAVQVVNKLVPVGPEGVSGKTDTYWKAAALGGQALVDLHFPEKAHGQPDFEAVLERVCGWLVALFETPDALTPRERAEAGDVLGKLGDPRPGVDTLPLPERERAGVRVSLPDILWVEVPAGPFLMGSAEGDEMAWEDECPQHTLDLPAFLASRYPITNAQYRSFVEGGGYKEPRYWTTEGWAWQTGEREPDLSPIDDEDLKKSYARWLTERPKEKRDRPFWWDHPHLGLPDRPVVGITWYEALAYCCWLTEQLQDAHGEWHIWRRKRLRTLESVADGELRSAIRHSQFVIRLPSEAEWEKAARGPDGRRWPWRGAWAEGKANTGESGIGETSAVGCFPGGASPYGAMDMAGNVWEWTLSRWGHTSIRQPDYGYPYNPADGREDPGSPDLRVVRGGSWNDYQRYARCASRDRFIPDVFDDFVGLRVVVSLALPSSEC